MKKMNAKKLLAGISSAAVIASALPFSVQAAEGTAALYGDANGDGKLNVSDAVAVLQYVANKTKYPLEGQGLINADCDGESGITGGDALAIQQADAGLVTLPLGGTQNPEPVSDIIMVHLNGTSITVDGDADNFTAVEGSKLTISHSGQYIIDGTLDDGQININIPDETADPETVKIFLNGASITGKSAPAILITNAENTSINLVDGTENTISDGDTAYAGADGIVTGEAVIEAKDDLTIKGGDAGTGILNLIANTQDGIVCNNDIKINGGVINITTLNSTDNTNGINGKKSLTVKDGTLTVDAEGDGIKSSKGSVAITGGTTSIKAGNDAIQSGTTIDISGGTVAAGGDRGLTSATGTNITGGSVIATATDNHTDTTLLKAENQAVILLSCIADSSNTDGCWKKANTITNSTTSIPFTKKYTYVLMSNPDLASGKTYTLMNTSTGNVVTHSNDASDSFALTGAVTAFENVNPAGKASSEPIEPSPAPVSSDNTLTLSGASITSGASADAVKVDGATATIVQPGTYTITGKGSESQIIVSVDKTAYPDGLVELDLSDAEISNSTKAPIYVESIGDEVQIVAKNGTVNTISDGTSHTDSYTDSDGNTNAINAAIFSRDDLKIKGKGTLVVNGNYQDGIVSKNDLKIYNGNIQVTAVDDGIRGKDSVTIGDTTKSDGTAADNSGLSVKVKTTAGDGIKSTGTDTDKSSGAVTINGGTVSIDSYADGIQAEQEFIMNGGDVTIKTFQGSSFTGNASSSTGGFGGFGGGGMDGNSNKTDISAKGIKSVGLYDAAGTTWQSKGDITINGGTLNIDSSDDSIHCGGNMNLIGGRLTLASADDAAHSDHILTIGTKGNGYDDIVISVTKAYEGIEGQKIYQNSGSVVVNSTDDGYNAAGGSDGSGNANPGGWGGRGGFGGSSSGDYLMQFNGGFAIVNVQNGDHDGYDSNGDIEINGGYIVSNGNEPFDCGDSGNSIKVNGGVWASNCASGGMSMGGSEMTATVNSTGTANADTRVSLVGSDGKVIISFIADKSVSQFKAGGSGVSSGASFYTGGTLSGTTYFQDLDQTQLAGFGGTLSGGTQVTGAGSSSGSTQPGFPGRF